jgi:hypothetical protein
MRPVQSIGHKKTLICQLTWVAAVFTPGGSEGETNEGAAYKGWITKTSYIYIYMDSRKLGIYLTQF